jgi:sterol desaturase/sphingolipid hydroxylase (fatty acid hydroxylase superfamily)
MSDWLLAYALAAYGAVIVGAFTVVAIWETVSPLRPLTGPLALRWMRNIALLFINQGVVYLVFPAATIGAAAYAQSRGWGLLPAIDAPPLANLCVGVLALDLARYTLHAAFHRVGWLWRLHRVHHSDPDYDCTIGLRFHPGEALVTNGALVTIICALGAAPLTALVSETLTLAFGFFVHANVSLPERADRWLRNVLVTPDLHRVHHSTESAEYGANLASVFSWPDRLFGTYRSAPAAGQLGMHIGLAELRDARALTLPHLLWMPFHSPGATRLGAS